MTRIRSDESNHSILRHFSQSRSRKKKEGSGVSSIGHPEPQSRSTTNSSSRTEASEVSESAFAQCETPTGATEVTSTAKRRCGPYVAEARGIPLRHRNPSLPTRTSLLCARIQIIPESESLETNCETSICVSVNVTADIELLHSGMQSMVPIDVVVCIQLSSYMSPESFSSSRDIVSMLAGSLQPTHDRIGLVVSQSRKSGSDDCCTLLYSLQRVDLEQLQRVLATLEQIPTYGPPMRGTVQDPLDFCASILLSAPREQSSNHSGANGEEALKHIFLITAEPSRHLNGDREDIQAHVINPGFVPWQRPPVGINGWQVHLPSGSSPTTIGRSSKSLQILERVVESARLGTSLGRLTGLSVDISAAADASIESILGVTHQEVLYPGQTARLLVRVKPGSAVSANLRRGPIPTVPGLAISSQEILTELDTLLGERVEELLHVKVRYHHTLLPEDTTLSTEKICTIKRHASGSTWTRNSVQSTSTEKNRLVRYQTCLAEFIASTREPLQALATLEAMYNDTGRPTAAITPIRDILQELDHLAAISKECTATNEQTQSPFPAYYAQKEHISNNTLCEDQLTSTPYSLSPISPRPEADQEEAVPTNPPSNDEAHRIWTEMRKMVKPASPLAVVPGSPLPPAPQNLTGMMFVSSPTSLTDPTTTVKGVNPSMSEEDSEKQRLSREISAQAVRNKRSVGADTLRSLAFGGTGRQLDSSAPWL
ncbi:MAG: GTPase of the mitochondrial inner membrane that associates with the large ribosomal subunit [Watsoniomyces obsoletus]|nr:MAG: GTPase of the mitochondrial inner membrane that associates with the large ribosomal subunit [Watsoniomyces obsoletus]